LMRTCHLNTCPVGHCPTARTRYCANRFTGQPPRDVINYFFFVADGSAPADGEASVPHLQRDGGQGRTRLDMVRAIDHGRPRGSTSRRLLYQERQAGGRDLQLRAGSRHHLSTKALTTRIGGGHSTGARRAPAGAHPERPDPKRPIACRRDAVGEVARRYWPCRRRDTALGDIHAGANAGQSFWHVPRAMASHWSSMGEARDYTGKGSVGGG